MKTVPIPVALLEVGKPLPVDVLSDTGQLLLRRGQPIVSEQHRDKLHAFQACTSAADGLAWQRATGAGGRLDDLIQRLALQGRVFLDEAVQRGHIGLVMLAVVQFQRFLAHAGASQR